MVFTHSSCCFDPEKANSYQGPTDTGFWWPMLIPILESKKILIFDILAVIIYILYWLNVVVKHLQQRYIMEAEYCTFNKLYSKHRSTEQQTLHSLVMK